MSFKTSSEIYIYSIDAIELNIDKTSYPDLSDIEDTLHIIIGEFIYCDVLIDAKLIVTENQLDEFLSIQALSIHKIVDSILYIHSFTNQNRDKFNQLHNRALYVTTENLDMEDEYELFKLL